MDLLQKTVQVCPQKGFFPPSPTKGLLTLATAKSTYNIAWASFLLSPSFWHLEETSGIFPLLLLPDFLPLSLSAPAYVGLPSAVSCYVISLSS